MSPSFPEGLLTRRLLQEVNQFELHGEIRAEEASQLRLELVRRHLQTVQQQSSRLPGGPSFHLRGYLDLDLKLSVDSVGLRVEATGPAGHNTTTTVPLPAELKEAPGGTYPTRHFLPPAQGENAAETPFSAVQLGLIVGSCLLCGPVGDLYRGSRMLAEQDGKGLRVRLTIDPELADIPWEGVHDGDRFLSLDFRSPLVRFPLAPHRVVPLAVRGPLRILVVVSRPAGLTRLATERERQELEEALAPAVIAQMVSLHWLQRPALTSLKEALSQELLGGYHVLHYIGHGSYDSRSAQGELCFEDAGGCLDAFPAYQLANLVSNYGIRLVFLNACETGKGHGTGCLAEAIVRGGVPVAVGMRRMVVDDIAIRLSARFYNALARNWPVEAALVAAREGVYYHVAQHPKRVDWIDPIMYSRVDDGRLFDLPGIE